MGSAYLCATLVSAALLPAVILTDDDLGGGLWVFVLIPIGLLVLHPAVLGKVFGLAERVLGGGERAAGAAVDRIGEARPPPHRCRGCASACRRGSWP